MAQTRMDSDLIRPRLAVARYSLLNYALHGRGATNPVSLLA